MFENLYGLSCVENQTLAILRENGMDIRPLYRDAAMPMKELFFFLIYHGSKQEYFDRITRVQDLAKELRVLSLELRGRPADAWEPARKPFPRVETLRKYGLPAVDNPDPWPVIRAIRAAEPGDYILCRVSVDFTKQRLHARALRNDHYVRVRSDGPEFEVINDIPEIVVRLTEQELIDAYAGDYFWMHINRPLNELDQTRCWEKRVFKAETHVPFRFEPEDFEPLLSRPDGVREVGIRMRDLMGVLKILYHRMAEYYGQYADVSVIREQIPAVEKQYAMLQYFTLKKESNFPSILICFVRWPNRTPHCGRH